MTGTVPSNYGMQPYQQSLSAQVEQVSPEYIEAQRRAAEMIKEAQEAAERQRRVAEQAAADQAARLRQTSQRR